MLWVSKYKPKLHDGSLPAKRVKVHGTIQENVKRYVNPVQQGPIAAKDLNEFQR